MTTKYTRSLLALALASAIALPAYAAPEELIQLTPAEKETFWNSPFYPASLSFVAPGSGQLLQSQVFSDEPDWFSFGRGLFYLGLVGLSGWQLIQNMNSDDKNPYAVWGSVLIGVNLLATADAFYTADRKKNVVQKQKQEAQLAAIYQNAAQLAEKKEYERAIAQLKVIPESYPQAAVNRQLIQQWQAAKEQQQKEKQSLQERTREREVKIMVEKKMELTPANVVMPKDEPINPMQLALKTQQKIKFLQAQLAEQQAPVRYRNATHLIKLRRYIQALAELKKIPAGSPYYIAAQEKMGLLQKWVPRKK